MNLTTMPVWLRYSERAFAFNFIAFSFVMFSCWFPTGFSATFSTFAFLFALPVFLYRFKSRALNSFEKMGLLLFCWLLVSVFWSDVLVWESLGYLSEYRIYFMLPVLISVLALNPQTQRWVLIAAMGGCIIALVTSYGLGYGWWKVEGAHLSLANRIYHGFIMASLLLVSLLIARESSGVVRGLFTLLGVFAAYNVLNIETGRTGYLLTLSVIFLFVALSFRRTQTLLFGLCAVGMCALAYLYLDKFQQNVDLTIKNVESMLLDSNLQSSAGHRLEYYRGALQVGGDAPLTGVGVGDVTNTLAAMAESGQIRLLTDNVHSEILNMLMAGGLPGMILFLGFVFSIGYAGWRVRQQLPLAGDSLIGVALIIFVSALFNSTIKDYGEKHALIIILSLLGAHLSASRAQLKPESNRGMRAI